MTLYRIRNWTEHYEKSHKMSERAFSWVAVPTKHDGKRYRRLTRHPQGVEAFAGFILMLEISAKLPVRGVLADDSGPLTAEDLSDATGFPSSLFETAFKVLCEPKIGWLEQEVSRDKSRQVAESREKSPYSTVQDKTEQDRTEHPVRAAHAEGSPAAPESKPEPVAAQPKPAKGRPQRATSPNHKPLVKFFLERWNEKYPAGKYAFDGKDGSNIGRILQACDDDLDRAQRMVSDYFSDSDPFIVDNGHTVSILLLKKTRYLTGASRKGTKPSHTAADENGPPPSGYAAPDPLLKVFESAAAEIRRKDGAN